MTDCPDFPDGTFTLTRPAVWQGGVILASPHSGRDYPGWFVAESVLDPLTLRSSEDAFVDLLIGPAAQAGAAVLAARVPRAIADLNRAADDLDPAAIGGIGMPRVGPRAQSGLGVIPRIVAHGRPIRHGKLTAAEAARRIRFYWHPYHRTLAALMDEAVALFGRAVLIDVHSMPHAALSRTAGPTPDIVLGDRNGLSASPAVTAAVHAALGGEGFSVRRNAPFAGAYIAARYGRPAGGRHVVQVEIDRSLYMDEALVRPHAGYPGIAQRLGRVFAGLAQLPPGAATPVAAE